MLSVSRDSRVMGIVVFIVSVRCPSVSDPDQEPYVFGIPGSGYVIYLYGSKFMFLTLLNQLEAHHLPTFSTAWILCVEESLEFYIFGF